MRRNKMLSKSEKRDAKPASSKQLGNKGVSKKKLVAHNRSSSSQIKTRKTVSLAKRASAISAISRSSDFIIDLGD